MISAATISAINTSYSRTYCQNYYHQYIKWLLIVAENLVFHFSSILRKLKHIFSFIRGNYSYQTISAINSSNGLYDLPISASSNWTFWIEYVISFHYFFVQYNNRFAAIHRRFSNAVLYLPSEIYICNELICISWYDNICFRCNLSTKRRLVCFQ